MERKPRVKLTGSSGNVFAILGQVQRAAKNAGWSKDRIAEFMQEITSGNYDKVLQMIMENFEVE